MKRVDRLVLISSPNRLEDIWARYGDQFRMAPAVRHRLRQRIEKVAGRPSESIPISRCVTHSDISTLVIHDQYDKEVPFKDGQLIAANSADARFAARPSADSSFVFGGEGGHELLDRGDRDRGRL
jgi:hypothetical protein